MEPKTNSKASQGITASKHAAFESPAVWTFRGFSNCPDWAYNPTYILGSRNTAHIKPVWETTSGDRHTHLKWLLSPMSMPVQAEISAFPKPFCPQTCKAIHGQRKCGSREDNYNILPCPTNPTPKQPTTQTDLQQAYTIESC